MTEFDRSPSLPPILRWTWQGRTLVFFLSAASIWCLLAEMYHLCDMRTFTFAILIPATVLLVAIAVVDRFMGDRELWRAVLIGAIGGLLAAIAYDVFRVPWVLGFIDQQGPTWLRLPLFKVFPRFGAMILGHRVIEPMTDSQFTLADHLVGWAYHFSNGITFGVMYMAFIGSARQRSWMWGIVMAVGLEIFLLISPYNGFFAIKVTALFVAVTLSAHIIFGVALGLYAKRAEHSAPAITV
ncbi:hypothetical protein BH10PLA1_BH10PLA1_03640 [soil metagenome]